MNIKIYFLIATYIALLAELVSITFRAKKIMARAGEKKLSVKNRVKITFVIIYAVCFALPVILVFREFSVLYNIAFCLVSVLGAEVITRDACVTGKYGVYENCVIAGGLYVFYDDIVVFPVLELPEEEQADFDGANLVISKKSKGNIDMPFSSVEECKAAVKVIRELSGK